jgi:hypothetical protein
MPKEYHEVQWYEKQLENITGEDMYKYYQTILKSVNGDEKKAKQVVFEHLTTHLNRLKLQKNYLLNIKKKINTEFENVINEKQPNLMKTISSESLNSTDSTTSTGSTNSQFELKELQDYYQEFNKVGNNLELLSAFEDKVRDKINDLNQQIVIYENSKTETIKKLRKTFINKKKQQHTETIEQLQKNIDNTNNKITQYKNILSQIEEKNQPLQQQLFIRDNHFNQNSSTIEDKVVLLKEPFQGFEEEYVRIFNALVNTQDKMNDINKTQLTILKNKFMKELNELSIVMKTVYEQNHYQRILDEKCDTSMLSIYSEILELYIEKNQHDIMREIISHFDIFVYLIQSEIKFLEDCNEPSLGFNMFDIIIREIVLPYLKPYLKSDEDVRNLSIELQEKFTLLATIETSEDKNFNALKKANETVKSAVFVSPPSSLITSRQQVNRRLEKTKSIKKELSKSSSMFNIFSSKTNDETKQELKDKIKYLEGEIKFQTDLKYLIHNFEDQQQSLGGGTKRQRRKRTHKNKQTYKKRAKRRSKKSRK